MYRLAAPLLAKPEKAREPDSSAINKLHSGWLLLHKMETPFGIPTSEFRILDIFRDIFITFIGEVGQGPEAQADQLIV